jgi:heme/copper-type cytochrome/quinol oxidase subunit 2
MKSMDNKGSVTTFVTFLVVLGIAGLLIGVLGVLIGATANADTEINTFMSSVWAFFGVIILIVLAFWAVVSTQRRARY